MADLLALRRHAALLPSPIRRVARALVGDCRDQGHPEGWASPLVSGRDGAGLPDADPASRPRPVIARGPTSPHRLTCLVVTDSLDVGGMDAFVDFLARGMRSRGVAASVLIAAATPETVDGRIAARLRSDGIEVKTATPATIRTTIRDAAPDVVSLHGGPDWVVEAAAAHGVPVVETLHGLHTFDDSSRLTGRSRRLAAVVAVSEQVRREYLARVPGYQDVVVVPNGVSSRRQPGELRQWVRAELGLGEELVFVSLGRYCLQKNTYGLLGAFDRVAAAVPDAHLVVAGRRDDASYFAQVAARRRRSPHAHRIHLRDHTEAPSSLLAAADAFVLDSFFEGWSLASTEALTAGLPVVLAEVGGAAEQLAWAEPPGFLVTHPLGKPQRTTWERMAAARYRAQPNAAELAAAMIAIARQRDQWAARREEIAAEAEVRFAPDICLARHIEVLAGACRNVAHLRDGHGD